MSDPSPQQTNSFAKGILQLSSGTVIAQVITIISAPVISRLFEPDVFGTYSLLTSIISIFAIAVCLRYEYAILLPEDNSEAANIFVICIISSILTSTIIGFVLWISKDWLITILKAPSILAFLWIVPIGLVIQGLFNTLNYWNSRSSKFGNISIARIAASLTTSVLPILLALLGKPDFSSLALSWLAGTSVFTICLLILMWRDQAFSILTGISWIRIKENLVRYRKFPLIDMWGGFINNLSWQLPTTILAIYFSQEIVGYYGWANRIVLLPVTIIGSAIAQVFFQRSSTMRSEPERLKHIVETVFRRLVIVGIFPSLVLGIAGPALFSLVFGPEWNEAGIYAQILSPWMFFLFISSPLSLIFSTLERQELSLPVNLAIFITRILALIIGGLSQNPRLTIMIWSLSGIFIYGLLVLLILNLGGVSIRFGLSAIYQAIRLAILPSAIILLGILLSLTPTGITISVIFAGFLYGFLILRYDPGLLRGVIGSIISRKPTAT